MTSQLLKAKQAGAQAILTYAIGPELAQIANGMEKLDWHVPMIGSWTLSMANFIDNAGKNGDGARMPQTFIQEGDTPKRKAFIAAYDSLSAGCNACHHALDHGFIAIQRPNMLPYSNQNFVPQK